MRNGLLDMKKRAISLILAVLFVLEGAAGISGQYFSGGTTAFFAAPAYAKAASAESDDEEWHNSVTGSAGVLEGKSVIISIFIDDKNSKWTGKEKKKVNKKVSAAAKFISRQAKRYRKKADLVTDIYNNEKICYSYTSKAKLTDGMRNQDRLYKKIEKFIDQRIDLTAIRTRYGTDSIGFLLHINKSGASSTLVHIMEEGRERFYECSTLFSKYRGKEEGASTYAHEMLHLFGARDLYCCSLADGITMSFVRYIGKKSPNDIMYSTYTLRGKQLKYKISNEISRVTAYFIGWKGRIPETKRYALPHMEQRGCFSDGTSFDN